MKCNIDRRGQTVRMTVGVACVIAGLVLGGLTLLLGWPLWIYVPAVCLVLGGGFSIFEARTKWCAVRAMGFRTPV